MGNILAAPEHNDRVYGIDLWDITLRGWNWKGFGRRWMELTEVQLLF